MVLVLNNLQTKLTLSMREFGRVSSFITIQRTQESAADTRIAESESGQTLQGCSLSAG